jgi:hypothetical protein
MAISEELQALASLAANTVVTAAVSDAWESFRRRFALIIGRGSRRAEGVADGRLTETANVLVIPGADVTSANYARRVQEERWRARLADFLEEHPEAATELRALIEQTRAALPNDTTSADNGGVAIGGDVAPSSGAGSNVFGVVNGPVSILGPQSPGQVPDSLSPA